MTTATRWWTLLALTVGMIAAIVFWRIVQPPGRSDPTQPCDLAEIAAPGAAAGMNVLLITLDTTRADHLSCYGYAENETPNIDALVAHGVRFDHAISSVPLTLPAHATILTGLAPYHHGVRNNGAYALPADRITLAEVLRERGYATAAFVAAFVLDERFGLRQGFDHYSFEVTEEGRRGPQSLAHERDAKAITSDALGWLAEFTDTPAEKSPPFFAWVHYYDPHAPYAAPQQSQSRAEDPRKAAYDAEIAYVDSQIGRLFRALQDCNLWDNTLIVLVGDHGEALGDHGELEHGGFIYDETVRVPLILSSAALFNQAYRVDDRVASTEDIVPTLAALLGFDLSHDVDGHNLLATPTDADRVIYIETLYTQEDLGCAPLFGLRRLKDKFILAPRSEYYDLQRDPLEHENLYKSGRAPAAALESELQTIISGWSADGSATRQMSAEEVRRLATLGYASMISDGVDGELPDPKDQVPQLARVTTARALLDQGNITEALEILTEIAENVRGAKDVAIAQADALVLLDRRADAAKLLFRFVQEYPSADVHVRLAAELLALRRFAEMERSLRAAEELDDQIGLIAVLRGDMHFQCGEYRDAVRQYRKALTTDRDRLGPKVEARLREAEKQLSSGS